MPGKFAAVHHPRSRFIFWKWLVLGSTLASAPADQAPAQTFPIQGPARVHFAGASIPMPPQQAAAWEPPATRLPQFLVNATADLFAAGVADPRGCEYRSVEVADTGPVTTHGFVLANPAQPAEPFVVGWDGIVYPALSVGAPADLAADIRKLADQMKAGPAPAVYQAGRLGQPINGFVKSSKPWYGSATQLPVTPLAVELATPIKVCLLLRLGRADLAETLFAAGTSWTADAPGNLSNYGINLLTLSFDWLHRDYNRAVDAFGRSDDVVALDAARHVAALVDQIEPKLDRLGFPATTRPEQHGEAPPHFAILPQYRTLLADLERRALEPARGPIPGPAAPAEARVAALIRDLDQITGVNILGYSMVPPTASSTEQALVKEGDAAVEPLVRVLESDQRLTRTISYPSSRHGGDDRSISPVYPVAQSALFAIFQTQVIPGASDSYRTLDLAARQRQATALRAFWAKNRTVPELERSFRRLNDPQASQAEWFDAATKLTQPVIYQEENSPFRGEPLRSRTNPSVTDLLARRVDAIEGKFRANFASINEANRLALILATWDPTGALPTLQAQVRRTTQALRKLETSHPKPNGLDTDVATMTLRRHSAGDPTALADYAVWAMQTTPLGYNQLPVGMFEPLWLYADDPALAGVADALFGHPNSPWVPLYRPQVEPRIGDMFAPGLIVTPLLGVEPFRQLVLAGLADQAPVSTVETAADGKIKVNLGESSYQTPTPRAASPLRPRPGSTMTLRRADFYALKLGTLGGFPGMELWWPEYTRNQVISACQATLRQYGARLRASGPASTRPDPTSFETSNQTAHFSFSRLDHPATADDVAAGRAIFHLTGAAVRTWPLPSLPLPARWTTQPVSDDDPSQPIADSIQYGPTQLDFRRDQLREGKVWQAEEVRDGERWRRFFGFVGHDGLARVPAEEVEFPAPIWVGWSSATADLDARMTLGGNHANHLSAGTVRPGEPIPVEFWVRNHRGISINAPTDWFRGGVKPSVARGVTVQLFRRSTPFWNMAGPGKEPDEEVPLRPVAHHDAGSQPLEATAAVTLGRLDLRDLFAVEQPGYYRVVFRAEGWQAPLGKTATGVGLFQIDAATEPKG